MRPRIGVYEQIAGNRRLSYLLLFLFVAMVAGIGYVFGLETELGEYAVLPALVFALCMAWGSYYYSDRIVLSMSQARPVTREQEPRLWDAVEGLSLASGLAMPKVYLIEDTAPNAFATGRDPQHAALVVTRGLLDKLERLELEGVIGHEMAHIQNYDIRFMMLVTVLVGTVVLLSDWMTRSLWYGRGSRRSRSSGGGLLLLVGLVFVILSPIIAQLMQLALSRRREFLADASGALLTRYPEGLARALEKITADPEPLEVANKATAHLYISNPLRDYGGRLNGLFDTHPPVKERVQRLREM
jgi:heat shock protein HtpX